VVEVYQYAKKAIEHARSGKGPYMLACYTYRIETHFMGDIDIRPADEVNEWRKNDPIENLERRMVNAAIMSGSEMEEIRDSVSTQVTQAIDFARQSSKPEPESALEHVYS
jgi:pyruvate dehydrogenase E1 component alpha subunit